MTDTDAALLVLCGRGGRGSHTGRVMQTAEWDNGRMLLSVDSLGDLQVRWPKCIYGGKLDAIKCAEENKFSRVVRVEIREVTR